MNNQYPGTEQPDTNLDKDVAELEKRTQQLNVMNVAVMQAVQKGPMIEAAREQGLRRHFAKLATRVRAAEEQFAEMVNIVLENHTLLVEFVDLLRRSVRAAGDGEA